jgi:H+-transporting ATPase
MKTIKNVKPNAAKAAPKTAAKAAPKVAAVAAPVLTAARPAKRSVKPKPAKAPETTVPTTPRGEISTELIAQRAFILWEQQGRPNGSDVANWLLAESQLKQEIQSFTA